MINKVDHIGIAVNSLEQARKFYEDTLGLKCKGVEEIEAQKVRTAFYPLGELSIELLEPTSKDSPVAKFINKNGEGVHHIAFYSEDLQSQLEQAQVCGCKLINEEPVNGAGGKKIAFLHPSSTHGVLTELCCKDK